MDKNNKIIIALLVIIAILACLIIASISMPHEKQDNVITIDGISFNTTNATDFKENASISDEYYKMVVYINNNGTGDHYVFIADYGALVGLEENVDEQVIDAFTDEFLKDKPHQLVNGIVVYSTTKVSGIDAGKPMHLAYAQNEDLHRIIVFGSPDPNETAKMAASLKFN